MGAVSCRRVLVLLLVVALAGSMVPLPVAVADDDPEHSHFRYGQILWSPGDAPNSVEFTVQNSWRRSGYSGRCVDPTVASVPTVACSGADGLPEPGDVIVESVGATTLRPGDGSTISSPRGRLLYLVTSVDRVNDWLFGVGIDPAALRGVAPVRPVRRQSHRC